MSCYSTYKYNIDKSLSKHSDLLIKLKSLLIARIDKIHIIEPKSLLLSYNIYFISKYPIKYLTVSVTFSLHLCLCYIAEAKRILTFFYLQHESIFKRKYISYNFLKIIRIKMKSFPLNRITMIYMFCTIIFI
mgnify:CR=1 FL=1